MLWINETSLSPLRQRNDKPLVGWGRVLCPCGLGGVCPFACACPLVALWPLPSCLRAPAPRGRGAVMFALPALFPTLALYDDVPVLVAAAALLSLGRPGPENPRAAPVRHGSSRAHCPHSLPALPVPPSPPARQGCVEGAGWVHSVCVSLCCARTCPRTLGPLQPL